MKHWALALYLPLAASLCAAEETPAVPSRYTFTWPLDKAAPTPRGGTTRGPALALDETASAGWRDLQAPHLSAWERDRRAILALVGSYRVSFDFLEVANFKPGAARDRPYQSWGTERVYLDSDTGNAISLVHLLEMRILDADGKASDPIVTKHWREDWQYQPAQIVEYRGNERWQRRGLTARNAGQWSQTVLQVDESPRYASIGHWQHSPSFSTWLSGDTWRPLPRREWTVRKDYQVLEGTNRVTLTPSGFMQEEDNLKLVIDAARQPAASPYLGREYGVARYERLLDADFAAADDYYRKTKAFWDQVHGAWVALFKAHDTVTLRAAVDQAGLFAPLFEYADQIAEGKTPSISASDMIGKSLQDMGAL